MYKQYTYLNKGWNKIGMIQINFNPDTTNASLLPPSDGAWKANTIYLV